MLWRELLAQAARARLWPTWAQYAGTVATVTGMLALRLGLAHYLSGYPILLFFAAIFGCAVLFGRRAGAFAVLLSAAYIAYFLLPPTFSFAIGRSQDVLGLGLFIIIGLAIAVVIEALHTALQDVTDLNSNLQSANARLTAAEGEKDLLLREAGHRMKNDLTMLVALVQLQQRAAPDEGARAVLATTVERIRVMARVHDRLHRAQGEAVISTAAFITELCDDLRASAIAFQPILLAVDVEPHDLLQSRAVAVGLIINELLTNALKYAFPDERSGRITVIFRRDDQDYRLEVVDDGVGMQPDHPHPIKGSGLGQRLIRSLAAQLGGTFTRVTDVTQGVRAKVVFPVVA
ncbi:DUF4118 domain-containing protein [Methylobacterium sp. WL64]|uniref:sensor histidine kinase n=1 Tax=Methylobacterium sp. WL64 TaxID=2603894 RepID=UPI0011CC9277|nr:histidine kinase dimerization/phosphoacceptor domain -containing protein [Methylobacterium sp. WL64]TXN00476.1 DUF4118 domain-containing protein [Methylobacterium sp. WL64]